ncbi:SDR family oxidoreductase [Roseateles violae]|uniref:SDR family oxidoreductase n=1 Tax=Roseateles violae TaxID=3058042 RepID=A0ABT8DN43_9BURK|nr:SDR family oxidoreductase [Pelomonas sp. PFR6]MDN3919552.1 SDR family oxidoreductase [Pelomonas sp. PFR6]
MKTMFANAVITGACGGFGQALARRLLDQGAAVALLGLNRSALDELQRLAPGRTTVYTPDVSDTAAMQACAADWIARQGAPDLVIANAGVAGGYRTEEAADLAFFRRALEINLLGVASTFQPFLAPMLAARRAEPQRRRALVGVASLAGWRGMPGNGAYCASKAGLIAYLQSLRADLRDSGLQVSTVSPGYLRTAMTAGNRFAMPGLMAPEVAAATLLARVARGAEQVVLPRRVGWLARALALLPAPMHDRILLGQPRKPRPGEPGATPVPGLDEAKH